MNNKITLLSKVLLLIAVICLAISLFVPLWRIELGAPQYPEGLLLQIYTNKLGGDVQIINGLNHYIGMKTLHKDDFIEFTVLPYIIAFFALATLTVIFASRKRGLYALFTAFVLFGIIAMVDFWRWEYDYGHNLDPHAAIIVPGMAYQPPLIGFKQLLNFGAYSIPDKGGWLFIASGILMLLSVIYEIRNKRILAVNSRLAKVILLPLLLLSSCSPAEPEPIKINSDHCDNCKMMISDLKFAAELVTSKGRIYKFDDLSCLLNFQKDHKIDYKLILLFDYNSPDEFEQASALYFVKSQNLKSPMGGNTAAFINLQAAENFAKENSALITRWDNLN
jgi:copper chaperone NosL